MAAPSTDDAELKAFAQRVDEICTDMRLPERGRQSELGRLMGVTPKAARRWLVGEGFPETTVAIKLARLAQVNYEWLMTGRGLKWNKPVDTKALVIGEAIEQLPPAERHEAVEYLRFKLQRSAAVFAGERLANYMKALDTFEVDPSKKAN
jgi:hypothetical protein